MHHTAEVRKNPPSSLGGGCSSACTKKSPSGGRPASLAEPPGPQERVPQRTLEPMLETFVLVPSLDAPLPQPMGQLVEVLKLIDTVVPEQVIDVPKITSQDVISQGAVLRVPQMAEQLVDAFDDFELVEEEEEESYFRPRVVPCLRSGGGLLVDDRHIHCPVDPSGGVHPGQGGIEKLAAVETLVVDVPVIMQPAFLQSVLVPQVQFLDRMLDIPVMLQLQVQKSVEIPQLPFFWGSRNAWFDSGYIFCVSSRMAFGRISGFFLCD